MSFLVPKNQCSFLYCLIPNGLDYGFVKFYSVQIQFYSVLNTCCELIGVVLLITEAQKEKTSQWIFPSTQYMNLPAFLLSWTSHLPWEAPAGHQFLFYSSMRKVSMMYIYIFFYLAALGLHCSARAPHCGGFSCWRAGALGARASVVAAHRLSSCGA